MRLPLPSVRITAALALALAAPLVIATQPTAASTAPPTPTATASPTPSAPSAKPTAAANSGTGDGIVSDRHTVTLITGDRVAVGKDAAGKPTAQVLSKAPGTTSVSIVSNTKGLFVLPSTALTLLAAHKLDPRLFDVTRLVANGYDDEHTDTVPLIATYPEQGGRQSKAKVAPHPAPAHSKVVRQLPIVSGAVLHTKKADAAKFWRNLASTTDEPADEPPKAAPDAPAQATLADGVEKLWLNDKAHATLDVSVPSIGAPQAWAEGYDGKGVKLAVLDTGVDGKHPDFDGRIAAQQNFTNSPDMMDRFGHGTHVASIAAGSGAASDGKYVGVAPKASLLIGKVLGDDGSGPTDNIIAGMEWAAAQGAKVINMSLGQGGSWNDSDNPLSMAVDRISASTGALFVIAAGNDGASGSYTTTAPGNADSALTVGATNAADPKVADFSGKGPRASDFGLKPEITAPGVEIVAARAAGNKLGSPVDEHYQAMSGTSMATPHVAGAAAILAQRHPDWTAQRLKSTLVNYAATDPGQPVFDQGGGRLRVPETLKATVSTDVSTLALGDFAWPQPAGKTSAKPVTYRNDGDAPVTLNLAVSGTRFDDLLSSAHHGDDKRAVLSVSPQTITVPAHGTAEATVTADIGASDTGVFAGYLTATQAEGGTLSIDLPVTYTKEIEQYRLQVEVYDARGERPTVLSSRSGIYAFNLDTGDIWFGSVLNGHVSWPGGIGSGPTLFPRGDYAVLNTGLFTAAPGLSSEATITVGAFPQIKLDKDVTVTFDARKGVRVAPKVPKGDATAASTTVWMHRTNNDVSFTAQTGTDKDGDKYAAVYAIPSDTVTQGRFVYATRNAMAAPPLKITRERGPDTPLPLVQVTGTHYRGDYRGKLIDVGEADPADLDGKDLRGAVVLLHPQVHSDGEPPEPGSRVSDRTAVLKKAGAVLALAIDSTRGSWEWGQLDDPVALPLVSIDEAAGEALAREIASRPVRIHAVGALTSPYVYYTTNGPTKSIPAQRQTLRQQQFATVDTEYHQGPADLGYTCRYAHFVEPDYPYAYGGSFPSCTSIEYPAARAEFVQANGARWEFTVPTVSENFLQYEGVVKAGQRLAETPFKAPLLACVSPKEPPLVPGETAYSAGRTGNDIKLIFTNLCGPKLEDFVVSSWYDLPNVVLSLDGEQIGVDGSTVTVDAADHVYRLVADVTRDGAGLARTSTRATTEWTFHSAKTEKESALPLPQIGLDVPVGPDGNATRPRQQVIRLLPGHQQGAEDVPFTSITASYSTDDGTTWRNVPVRHGRDGWQTTVQPGAGSGFVSLRVAGTDKSGNTVTETIIRAYGLAGTG